MFAPQHDFFHALGKARLATRRGDYAAADKWTRIAERHLVIADRFEKLIERERRIRDDRARNRR